MATDDPNQGNPNEQDPLDFLRQISENPPSSDKPALPPKPAAPKNPAAKKPGFLGGLLGGGKKPTRRSLASDEIPDFSALGAEEPQAPAQGQPASGDEQFFIEATQHQPPAAPVTQ